MTNDGKHGGKQDLDSQHPSQPKVPSEENGRTTYKNETAGDASTENASNQTLKNDQAVSDDKKESTRVKKGREDWGGYQGY